MGSTLSVADKLTFIISNSDSKRPTEKLKSPTKCYYVLQNGSDSEESKAKSKVNKTKIFLGKYKYFVASPAKKVLILISHFCFIKCDFAAAGIKQSVNNC